MAEDDDPFDWIDLDEDEEVLWFARPHPVILTSTIPSMVVFSAIAAGAVVVGILSGLPVIGILAAFALGALWILILCYAELDRRTSHYVITNQTVYEKHGILSRDVRRLPLSNVQNTSYSQSASERLFSIGSLAVYSAGSGRREVYFSSMPDPDEAMEILTDQVDELQS